MWLPLASLALQRLVTTRQAAQSSLARLRGRVAGADDPPVAWHQQQSSDLSRVALMGGSGGASSMIGGGPEVSILLYECGWICRISRFDLTPFVSVSTVGLLPVSASFPPPLRPRLWVRVIGLKARRFSRSWRQGRACVCVCLFDLSG